MKKAVQVAGGKDRVTYDLAEIGLPDVPLVGIHNQRKSGFGLAPHRHPGLMEICYLASGERVYNVGRTDYAFRGNELFVTYPDEPHGSGEHPHGKGLLYWMQVRLPRKPGPFLGLSAPHGWPLVKALMHLPHRRFLGDRRLKPMFEEIALLCHGTREQALIRVEVAVRVVQWLTLVVRCAAAESARRYTADIRKVVDFIGRSLEEPFRMEQLAALAGLSTSRFKAKFREQMGIAPAEYVLREKVAQARNRLSEGHSVTDVAYQFGFSSSQYFATAFKRILNITPRQVQRAGKRPDRGA